MLSALPGLLMQQSDRLPWVAGSWIGYALVWLGLLWYLRDQQRWSVHARLRDVAPHRAPPSATAAKPGLRRDCPYCGATLSKLNLQHRRARERPHSFLVPVALCCRNCQGEVVNRLHPMEQVVAAVSAIFLAGFMLSAVLYALRRPESWQPFLSWGVPLMVLLCAGVAVVHRRMGTMDWQRFEPDPATLRPPRFEDGNAQASRPVDPPTA